MVSEKSTSVHGQPDSQVLPIAGADGRKVGTLWIGIPLRARHYPRP